MIEDGILVLEFFIVNNRNWFSKRKFLEGEGEFIGLKKRIREKNKGGYRN